MLLRFLTNEVRMLNERLLEALYVPVEKRVLRRLVELADLYAGVDGAVVISLTQETLAELAGGTRPTRKQGLPGEKRRGTIPPARGRNEKPRPAGFGRGGPQPDQATGPP